MNDLEWAQVREAAQGLRNICGRMEELRADLRALRMDIEAAEGLVTDAARVSTRVTET